MTGPSDVGIGVLGSTTLTYQESAVALSPVQRRLLAALALAAGDGGSPEWLVEHVWSSSPPATARQSLHNHLGRLRRVIPEPLITWDGQRYRLGSEHAVLDVEVFEAICAEMPDIARAGTPQTVIRRGDEALALWRGEPYEDLSVDDTAVEGERFRIRQLRADLEELRIQALLDADELGPAISQLHQLVRDNPEREQRWVHLMVALARSGRRADALQAFQQAQDFFADELDLRPPESLVRLQRRILTDDVVDDGVRPPATVVGREPLLKELETVLESSQAIVLTGEAGIGKSTVAEALTQVRTNTGQRTVMVACLRNPWSALQPVVDLLETLQPDLEQLDPAPGPAVLHLLGAGAGRPGVRRRRPSGDPGMLTRDVADALQRVVEGCGGLTIVLDDADRGGPTSHRLLMAALERCTALKLVAATRQPESLPQALQERARHIAVGPLQVGAIHALASEMLQGKGDVGKLATWLHDLTAGNPLFATAVLGELRRQSSLRADAAGVVHPPADIQLPPRLSEVIHTSIASLALDTRRALDVAAVLDDPIDEALLLDFTDRVSLERAIGAGVLQRTTRGALTFRHELVRRVTYELIPPGRRVELHHAAATSLRERGAAPPLVAAHALAAVQLDPIGASQVARTAGEAAVQAMAFEEAARWFELSADAAVAGGAAERAELLRIRVEAADARRLAGMPGHAERLLELAEEAVDLCDDAVRRRAVLAAVQLGETGEVGPLQRRAAEVAARALEREADPAARAKISAAASMVHSLSGEPERCRELFMAALAVLADDDAATGSQVLPYAYMALAHVDDLEQRAAAAQRLRSDAAAIDDPVAQFEGWHLTFSVALQQADGDLAREAHREMGDLLDRVGDAGRRWSYAYQEAAVAHLDGRLDEAEQAADEALQIGSGVAPGRALGAYSGQLVELRRAAGRLAELAPLMMQLVEQQDTLPAWQAVASFVLAETEPGRSRRLFDDLAQDGFAALPRDFAWLAAVHVLARGAVLRRDVEQAAQAADVLAPYRDVACWQGTCSYGPIATVLAEIALLQGDPRRGAALAGVAMDRAVSLGAPAYVAEARQVLMAAG